MKLYQRTLAIVVGALLFAPNGARAESISSPPVGLRDVLRIARSHNSVEIAKRTQERAEAAATLERRLATLPSVALAANGTLRDREFTIATPMGNLPIGDTTTVQAQVQVTQPLLDASRLLYAAPAAKLDAKAARLMVARSKDEASAAAAEYYFAVLSLAAQERSNASFIESLEVRKREVESMVAAQRAVRADALRVDLALQDAKQQGLALAERRKTAQLALGYALGFDHPVEATPLEEDALAEPTEAQPAQRTDLLALRSRQAATKKRISAVNAELIPKVALQGALVHTNAGPQAEENFAQGMIQLTWVPFAQGSRAQRKAVHRAERSQLQYQIREAERGIALETQEARSALTIAEGQIALADTAQRQAAEAARVRRDRYQSGRETIGEVLAAEALVRDSASRAELAAIGRARALVKLRLAMGAPLAEP